MNLTRHDFDQALLRLAGTLLQHSYTAQDGTITLSTVKRDDLIAVRREDWDRLFALVHRGELLPDE